MSHQNQEISLFFQQVTDAFLLLIALWGAYLLRVWGTVSFGFEPVPAFGDFRWMIWVVMPIGPLLLDGQGFYQHPFQKSIFRSLHQIVRALVWLGLLLGLTVMFLRLALPSRAVLLTFAGLACALLLAKESFRIWSARRQLARGEGREPVLLAGLPVDMEQLVSTLSRGQLAGLEIVGQIDIERQPLTELVEAMRRHAVSRVIFAAAHGHLHVVQEAIGACETEGVEAWLAADFIKTAIARPVFERLGSRPMLVFRTTPDASWGLFIKRAIDFTGALVGLILTSPLLLTAYLLIKRTSPGPALFRQARGGRYGKPFVMFKFRTMYVDAEARRAELLARNQMSGVVFKLANDPRITPVGGFLRKWSVDELPQLFNVLRGDMSLVGPRPLPLYEVEKFESASQRRRLSVQPGLTGLWQISGRSEIKNFSDWVRLDLAYIDNWSLWLDIKILFKTIPAVMLGSGAK